MRPVSIMLGAFSIVTAVGCVDGEIGISSVRTHSESEVTVMIQYARTKAVDLLVVIDDAPSMAEEQLLLSENLGRFIDVLEDPEVMADYRIGVTTTSAGNPWCDEASAEYGSLVASSCRARRGDFVVDDDGVVKDATSEGCTALCALDTIGIIPTTTALDPKPTPRPWIERNALVDNLDGRATTREALECIGPQGIAGCRFASPLESMHQALLRMMQPGDPQYGFLRDEAQLLIVIIADGSDCSVADGHEGIFLAEDDAAPPVFWSDPTASAPTAAVCWNAGTQCEGAGFPYDRCVTANKDESGALVAAEGSEAVLYPAGRYIELVQAIEDAKRRVNPEAEVLVSLVAGVPQHYDGTHLIYSNSPDSTEQGEFGIGAGCTYDDSDPATPTATARPPVREKEFAEAFECGGETNIYSICQESYTGALMSIVPTLRDIIKPACMPACVADREPERDGLQPSCTLIEETWNSANGQWTERSIPECLADREVPEGADVCFEALVDDTISPECEEEGWNLEFRLVRGRPFVGSVYVSATCLRSLDTAIDCPLLP